MTNPVESEKPRIIQTPSEVAEWLTFEVQKSTAITDEHERRLNNVRLYYELLALSGRKDSQKDLLPRMLLIYERAEPNKDSQGRSQIWSETLRKQVPLTIERKLIQATMKALQR